MLSLISTHYRVKIFIFNEKMNVNEQTAIHFNGLFTRVFDEIASDKQTEITTIENILFALNESG